jgi:hypothetical protein
MSIGCIEEVGPEIICAIVKHEGILRKLIKSLQKCLACRCSSDSEEVSAEVHAQLCEEALEDMNKLCEGRDEWSAKDRRKWHQLANELVRLGEWVDDAKKDTPWRTVSITKKKLEPETQ